MRTQSQQRQTSLAAGQQLVFMTEQMLDLIYWRDISRSAVAFGTILSLLVSLAFFSIISVLSYACLGVLCVTTIIRVFDFVSAKFQSSSSSGQEESGILRRCFARTINLQEDKVHQQVDVLIRHVQYYVLRLQQWFLVEDLIDSLKFAAILWALTYVGAWFSGLALLIIAFVGLFTIPKVYEVYKVPLDQYYETARTQAKVAVDQLHATVPFLKRKTA